MPAYSNGGDKGKGVMQLVKQVIQIKAISHQIRIKLAVILIPIYMGQTEHNN